MILREAKGAIAIFHNPPGGPKLKGVIIDHGDNKFFVGEITHGPEGLILDMIGRLVNLRARLMKKDKAGHWFIFENR